MNFFINRPIFAAAIALMMILAGLISMFVLPIAQYPPLVPSQIQVSTQYIGASSDVVAKTVTTPLEEQLNGAEGINSAEFCPLRYHLMLVEYDRNNINSQDVLSRVKAQNVHAELIGPM